jgi:hypothetical protein
MGGITEWKYGITVERHPISILNIFGKTEYRPPLGPFTNTKIWEVVWNQWDHRNEVIYKQENIVTIEELELGICDVPQWRCSRKSIHFESVDQFYCESGEYKANWLKPSN